MTETYPRTPTERANKLGAELACEAFNALQSLDAKACQAVSLGFQARIAALVESELATLRERVQLEAAVVEAAIKLALKAQSNDADDEDIGDELGAQPLAVDALLAHRQRNNDGNR